ncbi:NADH-quinone oxidoreductase subunit NuoE [Desulfococcus sp.]|uniref:NADH-quinone oxidoreductase subunit NuoE n=1 Tax=Desulfococcus sp. TaxID=2025834 RepID=UPI00359410BD
MENEILEKEAAVIEDLRIRLARDYGDQRGNLIPILQRVQSELAYLPPGAIDMVAGHLGIPVSEVYGVATFYNQFRFNPPGRHPVKVCMGTACHVKGGDIILENFERRLAIREGETTADREFSIERVACVGCCALAPVALIGEEVHGHMAPSKVEGLFSRIQIQKEIEERKKNESRN